MSAVKKNLKKYSQFSLWFSQPLPVIINYCKVTREAKSSHTFSGSQRVPAPDEVSANGSVSLALGQPLTAREEVLPLGVLEVRHHHLVTVTMVTHSYQQRPATVAMVTR